MSPYYTTNTMADGLQEEVESIHPMTMDEIFQRVAQGDKFTPDSLVAARKYVELKQQKQEAAKK